MAAQDTPNLADTGNLADPGNDPRGDDIRSDMANPVQDEIRGAEEYIRDVGQTDAADQVFEDDRARGDNEDAEKDHVGTDSEDESSRMNSF